jgi:hypothetical protein
MFQSCYDGAVRVVRDGLLASEQLVSREADACSSKQANNRTEWRISSTLLSNTLEEWSVSGTGLLSHQFCAPGLKTSTIFQLSGQKIKTNPPATPNVLGRNLSCELERFQHAVHALGPLRVGADEGRAVDVFDAAHFCWTQAQNCLESICTKLRPAAFTFHL